MKPQTQDAFFGGRLKIRQHRDGYRFSIDSVLLAFFARPRPRDRIVDLGTGCGIVALMTAWRNPSVTVTGVEVQPDLAVLARANAADNDLAGRVRIVQQDLRRLRHGDFGPIDLVIANPPYRRAGTGRINPDDEKAVARHQLLATMADFIAAARYLLDIGGRFAVVYPAECGVDLICGLRQAGMEPKRLRPITAYPGARAGQILVEAVKGGRPGLDVEAALIVRQCPGGDYSPEVAAMLRPEDALTPSAG